MSDPARIGIVSVSDRASTGVYEDKGLPALKEWLRRALKNPIEFEQRLIPDAQAQISLRFVPTAILSRQVAVSRGEKLILNLPGQPKSIQETLEGLKDVEGQQVVPGIFAAVPYCIDLI